MRCRNLYRTLSAYFLAGAMLVGCGGAQEPVQPAPEPEPIKQAASLQNRVDMIFVIERPEGWDVPDVGGSTYSGSATYEYNTSRFDINFYREKATDTRFATVKLRNQAPILDYAVEEKGIEVHYVGGAFDKTYEFKILGHPNIFRELHKLYGEQPEPEERQEEQSPCPRISGPYTVSQR